jgi:hypothetical protein
MAPRFSLWRVSMGSSVALSAALLAACGADKNGDTTTTDPSATGSQTTSVPTGPTAGNPTGATPSNMGPVPGPTGGTSVVGPVGPSGPSSTPTTTGPTGAQPTGAPVGSSTGETSSPGDVSSGPVSGEDITSAPASTECTRELLDGLLDAYFAALAAGDASSLPLADGAKFTENAEIVEIGSTDFWKNAGETKYSQRALDTTLCGAAAQAVIPEGNVDRPVGLRIQVDAGRLTEIESIVVRDGDYSASFAVASNPKAIIDIADAIGWHDEVPEAQRATREQLEGWIEKYFRGFPSGVCNVTSACVRLENGGGNFRCSDGASCSANTPTTGGTFIPRITIVDEVRGIAAGFTIFDFQTTGHLDMHMMKMSGGEVHAVQAILRNTDGKSGWE